MRTLGAVLILISSLHPLHVGAALTEIEVRARVSKVERTRSLLSVGRRSIWVDADRISPARAATGDTVTVLFLPGELDKLADQGEPSAQ